MKSLDNIKENFERLVQALTERLEHEKELKQAYKDHLEFVQMQLEDSMGLADELIKINNELLSLQQVSKK